MRKVLIIIAIIILAAFNLFSKNIHFDFSKLNKIEQTKDGYIDWSDGYVVASAKGSIDFSQKDLFAERIRKEATIKENAEKKLISLILNLRINSYQYTKNLVSQEEEFLKELFSSIRDNAQELPPIYKGESVEITLKYPLFGRGSLANVYYKLNDKYDDHPYNVFKDPDIYPKGKEYTSLIIDCRNLDFNLSMFPKVINSNNKIVYSPALIKRNLRTKYKYITVITESFYAYKLEKTGKNPYFVVAEKILGEFNTDILINNEDVNKLFSNKKTIENLQKGKVFILVNKKNKPEDETISQLD